MARTRALRQHGSTRTLQAGRGMSVHREIIERWLDIWSGGDLEELEAILAPDFVRHAPASFDMVTRGLEENREAIAAYRRAFPDAEIRLREMARNDEEVFYRWTQTGTNTGPGDFPPTGEAIDVSGVCFARFRDRKMVEEFGYFDALDFMAQLGLMNSPTGHV